MRLPPRRGDLGRVEPAICVPGQAVVPDVVGVVQDTVEDRAFGRDKICHVTARLYGGLISPMKQSASR